MDVAPAPSSKWRGRIPLLIGAVAAVAAVVIMVIVVSQPRPEATLEQTGEPAGLDVLVVVNCGTTVRDRWVHAARHTRDSRGWDIWSGSNVFGSPCLVAIAPDGQWVRMECTPEPAKLVADTFPYHAVPAGG